MFEKDKISNVGQEPSGWVKMSDRLPDIESEDNCCRYSVTVLAADEDGYRFAGFFKQFKWDGSIEFIGLDLETIMAGDEIESMDGSTITQWMEIPLAPKRKARP